MVKMFDDDILIDENSGFDHHSAFSHKSLYLRSVVGITSALSIIGSVLIVLSYVCFKDLRTKAREILMHISFMDFGVGVSNLVGVSVNFGRYYEESCNLTNVHQQHSTIQDDIAGDLCSVHKGVEVSCMVQGSLATLFTIGSVLWTICLSMYLFLLVSQKGTRQAKLFVRFAYFFCYLMPIGLTLWMYFTDRIRYSAYESTGWCGAVFTRGRHKHRDIFAATFGYNLWILLTFILVPVLSVSAHMFIKQEVKNVGSNLHSSRLLSVLQRLDYKFLLVPVAFILLRIWSFIGDVWFVYLNGHKITPPALAKTLMYLEGIGDSGQGIANAILFVLFTKKVRERFICCWRHCKWRRRMRDGKDGLESRRLLETDRRERINSTNSYTAITPSLSPRDSPNH